MNAIRNYEIKGSKGKPILLDVFYMNTDKPKPVIIFSHGFKGFKDWGHFDLIAAKFAANGFVFVKFNFSYNGTTPARPTEFADLEAFGNNNFSIELDDLGLVMDWILEKQNIFDKREIDKDKLYLIGHSRGGGITILKAAENKRVKKIVTWAAVNEFGKRWPGMMEKWKRDGVLWVENTRTNQRMPLYWQLMEDYETNKKRLFIPDAVKNLNIPFLIIHGTNDEAVSFEEALEMKKWNPKAELLPIENGAHTFGGKHPYTETTLPPDSRLVVQKTIEFLKR